MELQLLQECGCLTGMSGGGHCMNEHAVVHPWAKTVRYNLGWSSHGGTHGLNNRRMKGQTDGDYLITPLTFHQKSGGQSLATCLFIQFDQFVQININKMLKLYIADPWWDCPPLYSPHKEQGIQKVFPCHCVILKYSFHNIGKINASSSSWTWSLLCLHMS